MLKPFHFIRSNSGSFTIEEAAKVIGKDKNTLYNWFKDNPELLLVVCKGLHTCYLEYTNKENNLDPELFRAYLSKECERQYLGGRYSNIRK